MRAAMVCRSGARSIAIGGLFLTLTLATSAWIAPAHAQAMQQVGGFDAYDPQWAQAGSSMYSGFAGFNDVSGIYQPAYQAKLSSGGTVGLYVASSDSITGGFGPSGNLFGSLAFPSPLQPNWFAGVGSGLSSSSVVGSYKSDPAMFNGLYSTASFGVTNISANPSGFSGLPGFNTDATAVTARAGVGLQLTPQISIEGSVGFTQMQSSGFR
jgi:hypothetical protein